MSPNKEPEDGNKAKETSEEVKLVQGQAETTFRWTLGRRRSKRESLAPQPLEILEDLERDKLLSKNEVGSTVVEACLSEKDILLSHIVSQSDVCSHDMCRTARAVLPRSDHLGYYFAKF